jgi:hypothetical protein
VSKPASVSLPAGDLAEARRHAPEASRTSATPRRAPGFGRQQWGIALFVVGAGILLQLLPLLVLERREQSLFPRILFWVLELPTLIAALSFLYGWSLRRRWSTLSTVMLSLTVAVVLGSSLSILSLYLASAIQGPGSVVTPSGRPASYIGVTLFGGIFGLFHCGLWALAFVFPSAVEDRRLRAVEADKLRLEAETLRAETELSRLRSQLEPHFLLNTLNAIAGLVTHDPREARRLLACLGELLSDTLQSSGDTQTLSRELSWLRGYASILESRFAGSLKFDWDVDEASSQAVLPRLLLQPLLENAVTHGALKRPGGAGKVRLGARIEIRAASQRVLRCVVEDNGPGFDERTIRPGAIGLAAVRRRLELWSADATLTIDSTREGTRVIVELPLDLQ